MDITARSDSLGEVLTAWDLASPLVVVVGVAVLGYLAGLFRLQMRSHGQAVPTSRLWLAACGLVLLALALIGPLDVYAERAFFVHMTQHLVLGMFAAPLLLAAAPLSVYMWALPARIRIGAGAALSRSGVLRRLLVAATTPWFALTLFVVVFYAWHLPAAYGLALRNSTIHFIQHLTMFLSGVLFWWPLIGPAPVRSTLSYPQRMIYLLAVVTPKIVLASIITLSGHVLYNHYLGQPDLWGVSDQEDQVISGLLMWIPGNLVFLGALTLLFFKWYESEEGSLTGDPRRARPNIKKPIDE